MMNIQNKYIDFKYWGPHFWYMLRCTAHNYQMRPGVFEKNLIKRFYLKFQHMIPNHTYKQNYAAILTKYPIEKNICCRKCLIKWVNIIYAELTTDNFQVKTHKDDIKKQYTNPRHWGPHYWFIMEMIASNYPEKPTEFQKNITIHFYTNLQYMLPCYTCRNNFARLLRSYKVENSICCRDCLIKWVKNIKEQVNKHS